MSNKNQWRGRAIVLALRRSGENDAIADVFTAERGRFAAMVYGGVGRRKRPMLEPGSVLHVSWQAKQDGALGYFIELEADGPSPNGLVSDAGALLAVSSFSALLRDCLVERLALPPLFDASLALLNGFQTEQSWPSAYVGWELGLLSAMGYGLDLSECALTGVKENLVYVSPRTGRAASAEAGSEYADKLLALPAFLRDAQAPIIAGDVADGFALTGHFLERELLRPYQKDLPDERFRLINFLGRAHRL